MGGVLGVLVSIYPGMCVSGKTTRSAALEAASRMRARVLERVAGVLRKTGETLQAGGVGVSEVFLSSRFCYVGLGGIDSTGYFDFGEPLFCHGWLMVWFDLVGTLGYRCCCDSVVGIDRWGEYLRRLVWFSWHRLIHKVVVMCSSYSSLIRVYGYLG